MDIEKLSKLIPTMEHRKKDKKRKKRRNQPYRFISSFPVMFPASMGTPRTYEMGTANGDGGDAGAGDAGAGMGESNDFAVRPSRARVIHEAKKAMGLLEFDSHSNSSKPDPSWGGYSFPSFGAVKMRQGGPTLGGPGFQHDGEGEAGGGIYDYKKSPGIGFRSEAGWRIWRSALEVMDRDATSTKQQILFKALDRAGIRRGEIDPAELHLVEMGIEWYLTDPGSLAAKRTGNAGPGGTGYMNPAGAP